VASSLLNKSIMNSPDDETERNRQFRKMADRFIDTANRQSDDAEPAVVSSAFLYGASRFCAFVVAGKTGNLDRYDGQRAAAIDYYTAEFKKMLEENLDNYRAVFDEPDVDDTTH